VGNKIEFLMKKFDGFIVKKNKWETIPNSEIELFYIVPQIYNGKTIKLEDGIIIQTGDKIAEIHINNRIMREYSQYGKIMGDFKKELFCLANEAKYNSNYLNIKAYYGVTILYPLAKRMHFSVIDLDKSIKTYLLYKWDVFLKKVFSVNGNKDNRKSKKCWLSKKTLIYYFGSK